MLYQLLRASKSFLCSVDKSTHFSACVCVCVCGSCNESTNQIHPLNNQNNTVESRLSGPPLSGISIIRLGSFVLIRSENGRVPEMRMRIAAVTMETGLLIFCACAENHVALLFINKVGGSRRGLSIPLSGYPACLWNQGVRIIEVLLYNIQDSDDISRSRSMPSIKYLWSTV